MERNKEPQQFDYDAPLDTLSDAEFDDALSKTLSAAVSSRQKSAFSSTEEFADWLRQGEKKRKQHRHRIAYGLTAAAAVFAVALYLCTSCFDSVLPANILLPWSSTPTYAGSDTENNITEENGSIVIGGDGNGNVGEWEATFTSYDDIPEKYQKEIVWFEDLPEGYELAEIKIEYHSNLAVISTLFTMNKEAVLLIKQELYPTENMPVIIINQHDIIIPINNTDVYLKKDYECNLYTLIVKKNIISLQDIKCMEQQKIEAMITSIRTGLSMP